MRLKISLGAAFIIALVIAAYSICSQTTFVGGVEVRKTPIVITPTPRQHLNVQDAVVSNALKFSHPYWQPARISVNLHLIRVWGVTVEFSGMKGRPTALSGKEMLIGLLDNDANLRQQGVIHGNFERFLERTADGIRVTTVGDMGQASVLGAGHIDQLLAILGELGVPSDTPVRISETDSGTVEDMVFDSIARFSIEQEIEWTTVAFSRWLPPSTRWRNRFGEKFCFDDLATAICARKFGDGPCDGIHVYYAAASLLRANQQHKLISEDSEIRLIELLNRVVLKLRQYELSPGGWDAKWSGQHENRSFWGDRIERLSSTGHHLEWLAIAPEEIQIPDGLIERGILSIESNLKYLSERDQSDFHNVWPISHAARALLELREAATGRQLSDSKKVELLGDISASEIR